MAEEIYTKETCPNCGMKFQAPTYYTEMVRQFHVPIGCPQGHLYWYSGTKPLPKKEDNDIHVQEKKGTRKKISFRIQKEKSVSKKRRFIF